MLGWQKEIGCLEYSWFLSWGIKSNGKSVQLHAALVIPFQYCVTPGCSL